MSLNGLGLTAPTSAAPYMQAAGNSAASGVSGAAIGAGVGAAAGSFMPILGNLLGAAGGAIIGGIFDLVGGYYNRKEAQRQQAEAKEMAERQWDWSQKVDRFNMGMQEKQVDNAVSQDRVNQLKSLIQQNTELYDHMKTLFKA